MSAAAMLAAPRRPLINFDLDWVSTDMPDAQISAGINARLGLTWRQLDDLPESQPDVFTAVVALMGDGSVEAPPIVLGEYRCRDGRWFSEVTGKPLTARPGETLLWLDEAALLATLPAAQS